MKHGIMIVSDTIAEPHMKRARVHCKQKGIRDLMPAGLAMGKHPFHMLEEEPR